MSRYCPGQGLPGTKAWGGKEAGTFQELPEAGAAETRQDRPRWGWSQTLQRPPGWGLNISGGLSRAPTEKTPAAHLTADLPAALFSACHFYKGSKLDLYRKRFNQVVMVLMTEEKINQRGSRAKVLWAGKPPRKHL